MARTRRTADRQPYRERGIWHDARPRDREGSIARRDFTRVGAGRPYDPTLFPQRSNHPIGERVTVPIRAKYPHFSPSPDGERLLYSTVPDTTERSPGAAQRGTSVPLAG